jgi:hypothetical protein
MHGMIPFYGADSPGWFRRTQDGDRAQTRGLGAKRTFLVFACRAQSTWIPLLRLVQADVLKAVEKSVLLFPLYTLPIRYVLYRFCVRGVTGKASGFREKGYVAVTGTMS